MVGCWGRVGWGGVVVEVPFFPNIRKAFFWENIRNFVGRILFLFLELGLKSSFYQNIRSFFRVSVSRNIRKYKNFLILVQESSISWNIRIFSRVDFFYFFKVALEKALGSCVKSYFGNSLFHVNNFEFIMHDLRMFFM